MAQVIEAKSISNKKKFVDNFVMNKQFHYQLF